MSLTLFINGKYEKVVDVDPTWTLLHYLRDVKGLKGTKLGCGEGGCGACTVMLSYYEQGSGSTKGKIRHISANACLTPLCALDGYAVTTVEGIGNMKDGLHPIQERLANFHGSQCGFCTPGIVMALYAQMREKPMSTPHELEECMDGNLCRCTGYRPIIDAVRSLSNNKKGLISTGQVAVEANVEAGKEKAHVSAGGCCQGKGGKGGCPCMDGGDELPVGVKKSNSECIVACNPGAEKLAMSKGQSEPIFPPDLMSYLPKSLTIEKDGVTWQQPATLAELLALKKNHNSAKLVVGNTEVGIETKYKNLKYPVLINPSKVYELKQIRADSKGIHVGAAVTLNTLRNYIREAFATLSVPGADGKPMALEAYQLRHLDAIKHQFTWFASNQIRNVSSIAGNITTASPIGDLNPVLISCGASLQMASADDGDKPGRVVSLRDFFLGYRKVDVKPNEIVKEVFIPFCETFQYTIPLKQARRREDDISIVTGSFCVKLAPSADKSNWTVASLSYGLGGMAPTPVAAKEVAVVAPGRVWDASLLTDLYEAVQKEFTLPENVPGGQPEFRGTLAASYVFRCFLSVTQQLQQSLLDKEGGLTDVSSLPAVPVIDSLDASAAEGFVTKEKPMSRGQQNFYISESDIQTAQESKGGMFSSGTKLHDGVKDAVRAPVGQPVKHKSADLQVTGEAAYTNDLPIPGDTLHACLVTSTKPHAKLLAVDISAAEKSPGFVRYLSKDDVTGHNHIGAVMKDEEVFAEDTVRYFGMVIGVVLADTHFNAQEAAKLVKVDYEDLPHAVSIEEAIAIQSFYSDEHVIESGDVVAAEKSSDHVVEGRSRVGAQEHFYLETNATVAIPTEHGHLEVLSSTQNPSKTQAECALVTGLPMSKVVCKCKRMGGGFGGKEERSIFIAVTVALAAHVTGKPVSILIERDVDMSLTGQRHSFVFDYKAGCSKDGKLSFLDATLYSNAGWSMDLSQAVMDRALFHSDNVYKWPAQRVRGIVCKTNQPSHTAFRGFGGPQGMMLTEFVMQHLSKVSGIELDTLRINNFYKDGDRTHFGQELEGFHVPRIFQTINTPESANVVERRASVTAFNKQHKWKKRGLCVLPTKFGINFTAKFLNQGGALVHVYTDGTVLVSHGGTEMGQGLHTKVIQIAAQCFGISHTLINVLETATTSVANSSPTAASMSTDLYGMAVLNACEQIRARLIPLKDTHLKTNLGSKWGDDSWKSVVNMAYFSRINLSAQGFYAVPHDRCGYDWSLDVTGDANQQRGRPFNYFTQGVACTEVEVDCLTGDSHVIRCDIVMDVGKSINPALDIGQIEGAWTQGYGWSTMEELVWGDTQHPWVRPGQLFTRGPGTYKIPAFNDVPRDFRIHLFDTANKFCVHSSKAVGEPPFFLGTSAFFAIWDAINACRTERGVQGFFNLQCPATSERIRMACTDNFTDYFVKGEAETKSSFQPKGSW